MEDRVAQLNNFHAVVLTEDATAELADGPSIMCRTLPVTSTVDSDSTRTDGHEHQVKHEESAICQSLAQRSKPISVVTLVTIKEARDTVQSNTTTVYDHRNEELLWSERGSSMCFCTCFLVQLIPFVCRISRDSEYASKRLKNKQVCLLSAHVLSLLLSRGLFSSLAFSFSSFSSCSLKIFSASPLLSSL